MKNDCGWITTHAQSRPKAEELWTRTKHYKKDATGAQQALVEVLQLDPRSVHQGRGTSTGEGKPFNLRLVTL